MIEQEELQKKQLSMQLLKEHLKQINQQLTLLDKQLLELKILEDGLENIKKTEKNTEILTPLGSGLFLKTELKNTKEVLMNAGANIVVEKNIEEAQNLIKKQAEEINNAIIQLEQDFQRENIKAQMLHQEIITTKK